MAMPPFDHWMLLKGDALLLSWLLLLLLLLRWMVSMRVWKQGESQVQPPERALHLLVRQVENGACEQ